MNRTLLASLFLLGMASAWGQDRSHTFLGDDARKVPGHGETGGYAHVLETGDEVLAWSLDDVEPGLYVAMMEVRTGSDGPLNMIPHYKLAVSDQADSLDAVVAQIQFHRFGDDEPRRTSTEYPVFVALIQSNHPVAVNKNSRQLQVTCREAEWGEIHRVELKPADRSERIAARLVVEKPFHLFRLGEPIHASVQCESFLEKAVKLTGSVTLTSPSGQTDQQPVEVEISPGQTTKVPVELSSQTRGCHFADLQLNWETYQRADHAAVGMVAVAEADELNSESMFGFHPGEMTNLYQSGFKWVRLWDSGDVWAAHEREGKGQFDFEDTRRKVSALRADGFEVLAVLAYSPSWASTHPEVDYYVGKGAPYPPRNIADWEDYCREYMTRFKGTITHFEVWNEPNTSDNHGEAAAAGFFRGTTDQYVQLLEATCRVAREVDPNIKVVGGSGTGEFLDWCEQILAQGAAEYIDILSFHSYTTPDSPEAAGLPDKLIELQELLKKYDGEHLQLWNTEVGYWMERRGQNKRPVGNEKLLALAPDDLRPDWSSQWPFRPVTEKDAAAFSVRHYYLNRAAGVEKLFLYSSTAEGMPLLCLDGTLRLPCFAIAAAAEHLSNAEYVGRVETWSRLVQAHLWKRDNQQTLATLWCSGPETRNIEVHVQSDPFVAFDLWGNPLDVPVRDGVIELTLSGAPIMIQSTQRALESVTPGTQTLVLDADDIEVIEQNNLNEKIIEATSLPHHGDRRVYNLPTTGDVVGWKLPGLKSGRYEIWIELRSGMGQHPYQDLDMYDAELVTSGERESLDLLPSDEASWGHERITGDEGGDRVYGWAKAGSRSTQLRSGDRIEVRLKKGYGFVGSIALVPATEP